MKKKLLFILSFVIFISNIHGQKIYHYTKKKASKLAADNISNKLKKLEKNRQQKIVVIIKDENKKITKESEYLSYKITHELNSILQRKKSKFMAMDYKKDTDLEEEIKKGIPAGIDESKYYEDLLKKYKRDYAITGIYKQNYDVNKLIIELITIRSNYYEYEVKEEQISVNEVSVANIPGIAPIYMSSAIPGWGQIYKKEKTKGLIFFSGEIVLIGSGIIFENFRKDYIKKALHYSTISPINQETYNKKAGNMKKFEVISFIAAGALHIYNIIDAADNKKYKTKSAFNFYPTFYENSYGLAISINW